MTGVKEAVASLPRRILSFAMLLLAAMGFLWIVLLVWQALDWGARSDIVEQTPSPGGRAVAYLVESGGDDVTGPVQSVVIGRPDEAPRHGARVLQMAAGAPRVTLAWTGPTELAVTVPCGRFTHAANFWSDSGRKLLIAVKLAFPANCPESAVSRPAAADGDERP